MPFQETRLDAAGQTVGRIASQAAALLRGKSTTTFDPSKLPEVKVVVDNAKQLRFTGNKIEQKYYHHFSGYPGGLKSTKLRDLLARSPEQVVIRAVRNMLPANKLRAKLLKRLTVNA